MSRLRLPTIGLRARLVAALVATAAATLAVAALALLSPLEHRLRADNVKILTGRALASAPSLEELGGTELYPGAPQLKRFAHRLARQTGARVFVFDQHGRMLVDTDPDAPRNDPRGRPFDDVRRVLRSGVRTRGIREAGQGGEARIAVPVKVDDHPFVIALRRSLEQAHSAVTVVRKAFLTAAVVGLGLALVLGIALATTLLRRLRRLRDAASGLAAEGLHLNLPRERQRDEVGEVARALAAMQERLQQEEAVRRAFVATASHELRTPLAALDAMLELADDDLRADPPDLEDAAPRVAVARAQTRRLIALANDLLELTRLDSGFELRSEPVELNEISRAVIAELAIRASERGVALELAGDGPCWVTGDPDSIARIARILMDNALRFSPTGGPVTVTVARAGETGSLAVSDVGRGVLPEERELVFERFKRGSDAGGEGGFGLGLAIGRELAERMGGSLELGHSEVGACFVLRLPAQPPAQKEPSEPVAATHA